MTEKEEKEWYSPHSIKFSKAEVKWLISILPLLRSGFYPPNPKESGYTDSKIYSKRVFRGAKFETPVLLATELDMRLERCGQDGLLLEFLYSQDPADELQVIQHIAGCLNTDIWEVNRRIGRALRYVCGRNFKNSTYKEFISRRKARSSS